MKIFQPKNEPPVDYYLRSHENIKEEDPDKNKKILDKISLKIKSISQQEDLKIKGKNLIYYSVFDKPYSELLKISICSLIKTKSKNFDILILTDLDTKKYIEYFLNKINYKINYKILEKPLSRIESSMCKVKIYDFQDINEYENILYLDCDIIAIKNIDSIFNELKHETLYVSHNNNMLKLEAHKFNPYIGFQSIDESIFNQIKQYNQRPFNAGQFLFKNSLKMKRHFENLNWFIKNWPGKYFFEQSFMNYYFCSGILINSLLDDLFFFVKKDSKEFPPKKSKFIHFVGPACEGEEKLINIRNYHKKYRIF
jgi:alpha-N-acetylglucosamine transferase